MIWKISLMFLLATSTAFADSDNLTVPKNAKWQEECGSCHLAYPPQLLAADNWQRMMNSLDKHFGTNAEIEANDNKLISEFLKRHASRSSQRKASTLRISDTPWFKQEHDEVPVKAWSDPDIKSPANCSACHINAERGNWSEDDIRMPKEFQKADDD
jgi:hypothetical protein